MAAAADRSSSPAPADQGTRSDLARRARPRRTRFKSSPSLLYSNTTGGVVAEPHPFLLRGLAWPQPPC